MQISSIIDVVEGTLVNSPSISFIYDIKTQLNKIHEGDLFVAKNEYDINRAIEKGAFGILYDFDTPIVDKEIAWIQVNNIEYSLAKLIRYKLSNLDLNAFYCNKITFELLNSYVKQNDTNIVLLSEDLIYCLNALENIESNSTIICSNKELLDSIFPKNSPFNHEKYVIKNLIEHSLFESTFSCGDYYFPRIKLPSLYINDFIGVSNFLNHKLDVNKLKRVNCFKPIFIDKYFKFIEHGHSNKFIITQLEIDMAKKEIKHLKEKYKYAKTLVIAHDNLSSKLAEADFYVSHISEIKPLIDDKKFNALYLAGFGYDSILTLVAKNDSNTLL